MGTVREENILFTGGSGLLGKSLAKLFPKSLFPTHSEFDVCLLDQCYSYILPIKEKIKILVHCAAIKTPPKIEKNPIEALQTNIIGTSNLVKICSENNIKLIYISSDYVFKGTKGNYNEEDDLYPVTKYGWSKLGGECAVRMYKNSLIIRMSFFPDIFPYLAGFTDQFISRIPVSLASELLQKIIYSDLTGVIHLGGLSKSTYEFAVSTSGGKEIKKISTKDIDCAVPLNVTMDISKLEKFLGHKISV